MADQIEPTGPATATWEYASAPESTDIVRLEDRYGLFINGEFAEPKSGRWFTTINPATEEPLAEVAEAGTEDVAVAVEAARAATDAWQGLPGSERAKYVFRIARQLQERAREFAVLETMNGGKPIKESRDVDLPLAAAHFFYYAGWADKLGYAFPGRPTPRPVGVAGQIIPWNFPMLMAAWKLAPALAAGNTVVLKPAETTPLTALLLAQVIQEAELPPGVVNIVTGAGETGGALVDAPGGQDRLHRLDRGGQGDPSRHRRHRQAAHAGARRQGREHRVRGRAPGPGGRRRDQRHLLQPGARVLRGLASARAGTGVRRAAHQAEGPAADPSGGRPARQEHRRRRHQLARPAREDRGAGGERRRRGRRDLPTRVRSARAWVLVPTHVVHRGLAVPPHRAGGDLRPGPVDPHVPHARRKPSRRRTTPRTA